MIWFYVIWAMDKFSNPWKIMGYGSTHSEARSKAFSNYKHASSNIEELKPKSVETSIRDYSQ